MSRKLVFFSVCVALLALAFCPDHVDSAEISWSEVAPKKVQPYQATKPNFVPVVEANGHVRYGILMNGQRDNCGNRTEENPRSSSFKDNSFVYLYGLQSSIGANIKSFGDIPPSRAFSGVAGFAERKILAGFGGVIYPVDFSFIEFFGFDKLFEGTVSNDYSHVYWESFSPAGDVPPKLAECGFAHNEEEAWIVMGVGEDFTSVNKIWKYVYAERRFYLEYDGTNVTQDGVTNPFAVYHPHSYIVNNNGQKEIWFLQGVNRISGAPTEITDAWAFNTVTKAMRKLSTSTPIPIQVRHGVDFQFTAIGETGALRDVLCTTSGDKIHTGDITTLDCVYDIVTSNQTYCTYADSNSFNGDWFVPETEGTFVPFKYAGGFYYRNKLYVAAGEHEEYYDEFHTQQVWNEGVQVLHVDDF